MDNTELHYLTYDPEAILIKMHETYIENGGSRLYPGDEKSLFLQGVLQMFVQAFAGMDNALRMGTLRYAAGEYLDLLGESRGCQRMLAQSATATATFVLEATGEEGLIPAGTRLTADGILNYITLEDIETSGRAHIAEVPILCTQAGSIGNALTQGTAMQANILINGLTSITASSDATGGSDTEEDESYRDRIRESVWATVTTGTQNQYEEAAKSTDPIILDARALYLGQTSGSLALAQIGIYLLAEDMDDLTDLIPVIQEKLNDRDTRALLDRIVVRKALIKNYVLNVEYSCDGGAETHKAIEEAVMEYQKWQESSLSRPFNPDKLMAMMYQAGATRVIWGDGCELDGEEAAYFMGTMHGYKGTITTAVIST